MDAIVIGAGPNGLVAANLMADAGWDVVVLEEQDEPGGAVKSAELTLPGFIHDVFSAFYPLAVASPALRSLHLENWGLRWCRSPVAVGHALPDGAALLWSDFEKTARELEAVAPGDGEAWRDLFDLWERAGTSLVEAVLSPFPPVKDGLRLAINLRGRFSALARIAAMPVRRLAEERFTAPHAGLLLAGNALHADLTPEMPLSGFFGFMLCGLGQQHGYPAPEGGAGALTKALVDRFESLGGQIRCSTRVESVEIDNGRAVGVRNADGSVLRANRAVVADVLAPRLFGSMVPQELLPVRLKRSISNYHYDNATIKVDWALDRDVPWKDERLSLAGTIHTGDDMDHLTRASTQLVRDVIPDRPPLVIGQMDAADPSRSPEGSATLWAYAHVPQRAKRDAGETLTGSWDRSESETFADRMQGEIERHAPGFGGVIRARHVMGPHELEAADSNLKNGAINGGTAQMHQQAIFRPTPGGGGPGTPIPGLYLASSSAHPGGGVHGACGANAARAALYEGRRERIAGAVTIGTVGLALARRMANRDDRAP